jgi:hypothetical protein
MAHVNASIGKNEVCCGRAFLGASVTTGPAATNILQHDGAGVQKQTDLEFGYGADGGISILGSWDE